MPFTQGGGPHALAPFSQGPSVGTTFTSVQPQGTTAESTSQDNPDPALQPITIVPKDEPESPEKNE